LTEVQRILRVARNDFSYFFRTKWLMAVLLSLNLSDMLVVGMVYGKLMSFDYFQFFVPAVVVMGLFAAALDTGRRIWLAFREGVIHYYLSLPISTHGLVIAYLIAGGLSALIYSSSLLVIALLVLPAQAIFNILALLPFLYVLAMGLAGLAASFAALASTHGEFYWAYMEILQASLLIFSTVYYPKATLNQFLPSFLVEIASANPLSLAAEAIRQFGFAGSPIQPLFIVQMSLTGAAFVALGAFAYLMALRRMQVKGKL
jgi:ABC-type polysaccharide/polyol phosphate export permease